VQRECVNAQDRLVALMEFVNAVRPDVLAVNDHKPVCYIVLLFPL
jgi:hypothetical protein